jgi:hypothetical protein
MNLTARLQSLKESPKSKPSTEWQELGKELTAKFGKNCYWILWKYPIHKIYEALKVVGDKDLKYFIGILNKH